MDPTLIRNHNARIIAAHTRFNPGSALPVQLMCECDLAGCDAMIHVTIAEHEARGEARWLFIALGHDGDRLRAIDSNERFTRADPAT